MRKITKTLLILGVACVCGMLSSCAGKGNSQANLSATTLHSHSH